MTAPYRTMVKAARKLISPGTIKSVHFRFDAGGGHAGYPNTGWLRVPKVEAKRLLRNLHVASWVWIEERSGGVIYIHGEHVAEQS